MNAFSDAREDGCFPRSIFLVEVEVRFSLSWPASQNLQRLVRRFDQTWCSSKLEIRHLKYLDTRRIEALGISSSCMNLLTMYWERNEAFILEVSQGMRAQNQFFFHLGSVLFVWFDLSVWNWLVLPLQELGRGHSRMGFSGVWFHVSSKLISKSPPSNSFVQ